jgi:hypothetical protein
MDSIDLSKWITADGADGAAEDGPSPRTQVVHDHWYHNGPRTTTPTANLASVTAGGAVSVMANDDREPFYNPQYGRIVDDSGGDALVNQLRLTAHSAEAGGDDTALLSPSHAQSNTVKWTTHTNEVMAPKCSAAEYKGETGSPSNAEDCLKAAKAKVGGCPLAIWEDVR